MKHPFIKFKKGSFVNVKGRRISFLICVNVLHSVKNAESNLKAIIKNNDIAYLVVDKVQSPPYQYSHEFNSIFENLGYHLYKESQRFEAAYGSSRKVLIYKK
ncbi:MAG: hypothetical protein LUI12_04815 [Clostridiales bacterium]|nr:hypothetical protein [Clostridiales bacterium]